MNNPINTILRTVAIEAVSYTASELIQLFVRDKNDAYLGVSVVGNNTTNDMTFTFECEGLKSPELHIKGVSINADGVVAKVDDQIVDVQEHVAHVMTSVQWTPWVVAVVRAIRAKLKETGPSKSMSPNEIALAN
jgi:sulfur carrier protein ThiS